MQRLSHAALRGDGSAKGRRRETRRHISPVPLFPRYQAASSFEASIGLACFSFLVFPARDGTLHSPHT